MNQSNAPKKCQQHSGVIVALDPSQSDAQNQGLCLKCIQNPKKEFILLEDAQTEIAETKQEARQKRQQLNFENIELLEVVIQQVQEFKRFFNQSLDKLGSNIQQWINWLQSEPEQFEKSLESIDTLFSSQFKLELSNFDLKRIKAHYDYKKFIHDQFQQISQNKLVKGDKVTQGEYCRAIAFNKESDIKIAGCNEKIKVFQFKLGRLKQIQLLGEHTFDVTSLYFMKKSNEFISAHISIRIWGNNNGQQWCCKQLLKDGHTGNVNCVIMNRMEDLIISCSCDKSTKFWVKRNEWECSQTLMEHTAIVWSVSLNDSQNQLVSCGDDQQILLFKIAANKSWEKIQSIKIARVGVRLCFLADNLITFNLGKIRRWKYLNKTNRPSNLLSLKR